MEPIDWFENVFQAEEKEEKENEKWYNMSLNNNE